MTNAVIVHEGALKGSYACTLWGELIQLEGAQSIGVFANDYYANGPALTVHQYGLGKAYYLATHGSDELVAVLVSMLCQDGGIEPVMSVPAGVEVTRRLRDDGRGVYFLLNHSQQSANIALPTGMYTSLLNGARVKETIEVAAADLVVLLEG